MCCAVYRCRRWYVNIVSTYYREGCIHRPTPRDFPSNALQIRTIGGRLALTSNVPNQICALFRIELGY
jgi:hypothetical protein